MLSALFRPYVKFRSAQLKSQEPAATQKKQLLRLVQRAANTAFGRQHGFNKIRSVQDFQRQVPLRYYEDFWRDYWQKDYPRIVDCTWPGLIEFWPLSSGTTSGTTKYIPCSREMLKSNQKASLDLLVHHFTNRPKSRALDGKSFWLGSSTDLNSPSPGVYSGDLSGIVIKTMPFWGRWLSFPPPELAVLKDWQQKIERFSLLSPKQNITILSGVPSWLLILFKHLGAVLPGAESDLSLAYPKLEMLVHGGVNFAPYKAQFEQLLAHTHAELREVYPASEGFIAIADRGSGEGLRLILDHSIFFEFVPVEELKSPSPTRHWAATLETDVNYAVVLSSCAGVWSYVLGDTVKFVQRSPARLLITGRTSYYLSAFGEHLVEDEIEDGVSAAAQAILCNVTDFSVGPIYPKDSKDLGQHLFIVEFEKVPNNPNALGEFASRLDAKLCERNEDYAAHRANGFGLKAPQIKVVAPGFFAAWMKSRGKFGGQHKVPRVINDQTLLANLDGAADKQLVAGANKEN